MKKLCVIGNPNIIHIRRWAQDFTRLGWDVHLIGEHKLITDYPVDCTFYDLPTRINLRKFRYLTWIFLIRKILREIKPDAIHALGVASAGWLGAASRFHPFICTSLGSDLMLVKNRSKIHQLWTQFTLNRVDKLICVSSSLDGKAAELGVPSSKREIINLGVDTRLFSPPIDRTYLRKKLNLPDHFLVLNIRAIQSLYQPLTFARVVPEVLKQVPDTSFIIFTYNADEKLLSEFKGILNYHAVIDRVFFIPPLFDDQVLAEYYKAADVAVSIPVSDGMPVSVMESMACGTAVIASDLPNLHDFLQNGLEGILVPVNDELALQKAIMRLLTNFTLRHSIQTNGLEAIRKLADRANILEKVQKIYQDHISLVGCKRMEEE